MNGTMQGVICLAFFFSTSAAAYQPSQIGSVAPIIGTWKFKLTDRNCTETYTYKADGTTRVTSNEEISESRYQIALTPTPNGFYKMVDTITKDNGRKDCTGDVMTVGDTATTYVLFQPSGDQFIACQTPSLDLCFGPLIRVSK